MARLAVTSVVLFAATLATLLFVPFPAEAVAASLLVLVVAILCLALIAVFAAARGSAEDRWVDRVPLLLVPPLAAFTLWSLSVPGVDFFSAAVAALVWLAFGVLLLVRIGRLLAQPPVRRDLLALWTCALFVGLLVFSAGVSDVPLEVRFALSKEAMNDVALAVISGERDPGTIDRIGLWNVDDVERVAGGMQFRVREAGFLSSTGFAYRADGLPPSGEDSYRYYRAGWYIWTGQSS